VSSSRPGGGDRDRRLTGAAGAGRADRSGDGARRDGRPRSGGGASLLTAPKAQAGGRGGKTGLPAEGEEDARCRPGRTGRLGRPARYASVCGTDHQGPKRPMGC